MDVSGIILLATEVAEQTMAAESESAQLLGTLGIDLKLFIAQLINFAIVLFVLWKWVFGPIGTALEQRRARVEKSLRDAQDIEQRVQAFEREHQQRLQQSRKQGEGIISEARAQASELKTEIQKEAKAQAERTIARAKEQVTAEKEQAVAEIRREAAELTLLATEKVLQEKLDEQKDKKIVEDMLKAIK